jgi:hypothetical protein
LADIKECEEKGMKTNIDFDLWDEQGEGVGWLDNELGFFEQVFKVKPSNWSKLKDVDSFYKALETYPMDYLRAALIFLEAGGSSNKEFVRILKKRRVLAKQ